MIITPPPDLPFQQVAVDFYHKAKNNYLIYADRYSGWTEVARMQSTSFKGIQKDLLSWFRTYGVPEEIASDGGPPFRSTEYTKFLSTWGITPRLSSAHYPQSNGRAEIAVRIMKRALDGSLDPRTGEIDTEKAAQAILTHRNTPNKETGIAPSEMLFGYKLKDHLPNKFRTLRKEWKDLMKVCELQGLKKEKQVLLKTGNRRTLKPLNEGDIVSVQNQTGNQPLKWSNTGVIVKVHPHRQYSVMIHASRRVTLRNRKFLRKLDFKATNHSPNTLSPPISKSATRMYQFTTLIACTTK